MKKIFIVFLLVTCYLSHVTSSFAHFVKSDGTVGAVLHVDPGDDPIAGEQGNIILEFKDTQNRFNLNNCECTIRVTKENQDIINQDLGPVSSEQSLSSVTPILFPEKNIYKLIISGRSSDNSYPDFVINYDIRVERETEAKTIIQSSESSNWYMDHIIHIIGGIFIAVLLASALVFQKKKIAVIILVLLLLGHSVPVKAIHASHNGPIDSASFICCLPVAADMPEFPEVELPVFKNEAFLKHHIFNTGFQIPNLPTIRPPPF